MTDRLRRTFVNSVAHSSLDHLVGAGEQGRGTSRPSALAVLRLITRLEFCRLLHRQVGRFLATQNPIDVGSGTPMFATGVRPIRDKTARRREIVEMARSTGGGGERSPVTIRR